MTNQYNFNRTALLFTGWAGPVQCLLFCLAFVVFSKLWPNIPSPSASSQEIANFYWDNAVGMRIGTLLMYFAGAAFCIWGAGVTAIVSRTEKGIPVLTYAQLIFLGSGGAIGAINFTLWSVASFRPGELSPDVVRMLNDIGFFLLLWSGPIFSAWLVIVALSMFCDESEQAVFPSWMMYMTLLTAFLVLPGAMITFFHEGPFAFDGLFGFYLPVVSFFCWVVLMSWSILSIGYKIPKK